MNFGVLPLRAIAFQILFLLISIALEALILYRRLGFDHKTSIRYATSINLFSTFVGWLIFFNVQAVLPENWRVQLVSFFFFDRLMPNPWSPGVAPILTLIALGTFLSVVFVELQGLNLLETIMETRTPDSDTSIIKPTERPRFQRLGEKGLLFQKSDRAYTVFVANSLSFTAVLIVLLIRWLDQTF